MPQRLIAALELMNVCIVALYALAFTGQSAAENALVMPVNGEFFLRQEVSRIGLWNFGGSRRFEGTVIAVLNNSEVEVFLVLSPKERVEFPYLKELGPPEMVMVDDYDASEKLFDTKR